MADRLDPAVATEPAPPLTADPEGEALTSTLGVSAVVRTLHELFGHPAGTLGLVIGQASNGPDRYRVMIPGNPHEYSLRGRDVEVVQGIERWYQRWSRERYWRELAGMLTTEVEHLREVAAHGQTLAVEVGALREEVEHLRGQRDADGCWWRDENVRLAARIAELCGERDAARVALGDVGDPPAPDTRPCRACGRPFSPTHDSSAPGPTVRHPYVPVPTRPVGGAGDTDPDDPSVREAIASALLDGAPPEAFDARTRRVLACVASGALTGDDGAAIVTALAARTATPPPGVAGMLAEFHDAFGQPFGHGSIDASDLRVTLHEEEHRELLAAYAARDLAAVAHELADVVYVAYGSAHSLGIPLDEVIAEVHRANMSKFGEDGRPVLREDGKVMKGPGYRPPDVAAVLAGRTATPPPAAPEIRTDWGVCSGAIVEAMPETRAREVAAEHGGVVVRRDIAVTEWEPVTDDEEKTDGDG